MNITHYTKEEHDLMWEVFFQGIEQPCHQMFNESDNLVLTLNEKKGDKNEIDQSC